MNKRNYMSAPALGTGHASVAGPAYQSQEDPPQSASFDDIVFENRNRDYGAYVLRRAYLGNVLAGLVITSLLIALILLSPRIMALFSDDGLQVRLPPPKLIYTELSAPPPIDKPKPPPPNVSLPRLQKVVKFVPPVVVREQVVEHVPTIQEIREHEIAAVAVESEIVFDEPAPPVVEEDNTIFTVVEQQPEFAGGYEALMLFIQRNMVYPPAARRMGIEGTVHVSFVVSKIGEISDIQILRGISTECDQEAVRVLSLMPPWVPGRQNGHPVNVRFIMPLKFRLG